MQLMLLTLEQFSICWNALLSIVITEVLFQMHEMMTGGWCASHCITGGSISGCCITRKRKTNNKSDKEPMSRWLPIPDHFSIQPSVMSMINTFFFPYSNRFIIYNEVSYCGHFRMYSWAQRKWSAAPSRPLVRPLLSKTVSWRPSAVKDKLFLFFWTVSHFSGECSTAGCQLQLIRCGTKGNQMIHANT